MTRFVVRRIIQAIPLLLLISVTVFGLMQLIPGGPLAAYASNPEISTEDLVRLQEELGMNVPKHQQYLSWLSAVLRGDLGTSQITLRPALVEISERLPNTLYLSVTAFLISLLVSIPIGILSAVHQYSWFDHVITTIAFIGRSIPLFWFGLILIVVFNVTLRNPVTGGPLLPGGGMYTIGAAFSVQDRITHLILPVSVLVLYNLSIHVRYLRAGMLDVLHQDYVRTARAKGLHERTVILRHAIKNALLPLVTIIGLEIPGLFGGVLVIETIFSWPGMGRLFFNSIERADYAVMMGIIMISATLLITFGLITDIVYAALDPRIRFDQR